MEMTVMTLTETVMARVTRLPPEKQEEVLDFVEFLAAKEVEPEYDSALDAVLRRRIAEIENGRVQGIPAEQVIREMRAKYG
jgi:putative addiction module component (TIGR02574 family)